MQGFSDFLDLKIRVQFSETILNRHSFCIHATVNIRNPFPDFLDLKLWVQFPELKTMCSVFWTETIWNRFSGLKNRGTYSEKIQEKNQEDFKVLKLSKIVLKCPNVFWGQFFKIKLPSNPWRVGSSKIFKKVKKFSNFQKCPKSIQKMSKHVLNMLWGDFSECFCPVFHAGLFRFSGLKNMSSVIRNNTQQTIFLHSRHSQYTQSLSRFSGLKIMSSDPRT